VYIWGKYEENALGDFIQERMIISMAWKWLGEKKVYSMSLPDSRGYRKDPKNNRKLIEKLHTLFSAADIIVGQNSDNFDIKMANAEFLQYGLTPPSPYKTFDTLKVARAKFRFNSNKLDDLGKRLGLGRKVKTGGFDLWLGCLNGDKKAWAKMVKYNKQDVILLEKIYLKLRPWSTNHPNVNVFDEVDACPVCSGTRLQRRGWAIVGMNKRRKFQCQDCGKWSQGVLVKAGLNLR
jgi:DNA polymerase elongation subunit (family B)